MTFLVQTLLVRQHKVLLGRWHTGAFKGRVTGLLGSAPGASPEVAATRICRPHLGPVEAQRLRRRGIFQFEEQDEKHESAVALGAQYQEYQLVYRVYDNENVEVVATDDYEPIGWFGQGEIPFDQMPEDDAVWYERVLFKDHRLRGTFSFQGTSLVKHTLEQVSAEEGLCESLNQNVEDLLLLHNPDCSKSRALKEALDGSRSTYTERLYLEEPLTLSELEIILARLKADDASFTARALSRDQHLSVAW
ncbi:E3 ubiquitin-protein ligase arkadia [Durusdinium trenchii]|uniref:E3 ubiquitin-protein ligase arkadia n=1 Tax=Durusdinium trenchii TaxID=1381693 RepID=A0ABP0LCL7_9DINO